MKAIDLYNKIGELTTKKAETEIVIIFKGEPYEIDSFYCPYEDYYYITVTAGRKKYENPCDSCVDDLDMCEICPWVDDKPDKPVVEEGVVKNDLKKLVID